MILGMHHIELKTTPKMKDRVIEFYCNFLGFKIINSWSDGIMLENADCKIEIFFNSDSLLEKGVIGHIAFKVADVDAICNKTKELGYEIYVEPKDIKLGNIEARIAFCYGPINESIEFFCER